jgi:hypothetical protein
MMQALPVAEVAIFSQQLAIVGHDDHHGIFEQSPSFELGKQSIRLFSSRSR